MNLNEILMQTRLPVQVEIESLQGPENLTDRLREMGFFEGIELEVSGRLPFGGPWIVQIGATCFALREEEARCAQILLKGEKSR